MKTASAKPVPKVQKVSHLAKKPFVSIVVPAFNEAAIIEKNLATLCEYMESIEDEYQWELVLVNDGSTDETGDLAEAFAKTRDNVHVLHHMYNFRLGQAFRYAFNNCQGDYIVTMDSDLSYSPDHIGKMLDKIRKSRAKIVIASPYMKGGKVSNVPWLRRTLSKWANRYLSFTAKDRFSDNLFTLTSMVRAYDAEFLSRLNLKAMDMEILPEIIYKAMILRARIVEIPAHLNWGPIKAESNQRKSSISMARGFLLSFLSGFIFRPFMFFVLPGLALSLISLYTISWAVIHTVKHFQEVPTSIGFFEFRIGYAMAEAFKVSPQSFIIGGITLMLAIQLISLGILAFQNKRYYEELFHLSSAVYKLNKGNEGT